MRETCTSGSSRGEWIARFYCGLVYSPTLPGCRIKKEPQGSKSMSSALQARNFLFF